MSAVLNVYKNWTACSWLSSESASTGKLSMALVMSSCPRHVLIMSSSGSGLTGLQLRSVYCGFVVRNLVWHGQVVLEIWYGMVRCCLKFGMAWSGVVRNLVWHGQVLEIWYGTVRCTVLGCCLMAIKAVTKASCLYLRCCVCDRLNVQHVFELLVPDCAS